MDSMFGQGPDFTTSSFNERGGAILHLYSPRYYDTQVLRPYSYQITENGLDRIMHGGNTLSDSLGNKDIIQDPSVAGSIQPISNGTPLDMSTTNCLWTFVLQIDLVSPWLGGASHGRNVARRRLLYSGVCLDEPISTLTMWNGQPVLNDNCPMRFTHAIETVVDPAVGGTGAQSRVMVRSDVDIVDASLNGQANNTDLYLATPDRVLANTDTASGISREGLAALANIHKGVGVVTSLKAPMQHLRQLLIGLDQQIHLCESSSGMTIANHMQPPTDVYDADDFRKGVINEWGQMSSGLNDMAGNIEAGDIMLLGFIHKTYPDIIVIPYKLSQYSPVAEQNGLCDQRNQDPRTIYSSMIAAAVSAYANNFGLSMIDFSYDSYVGQFDTNREGSFEVRNADLLMPPSDPTAARELLAHALELFRRQIVNDLVPVIKAAKLGGFQMNVMFMVNAETYVDLNLYDWQSLSNGGIYETTNRIANVGSTSVSTSEQFLNNGTQLEILVNNVYGKNIKNQFGFTAFGNDAGDLLNTAEMEGPGMPY